MIFKLIDKWWLKQFDLVNILSKTWWRQLKKWYSKRKGGYFITADIIWRYFDPVWRVFPKKGGHFPTADIMWRRTQRESTRVLAYIYAISDIFFKFLKICSYRNEVDSFYSFMHAPHNQNKCIINLLKYKNSYLSNTKKITIMNNAGLSNKIKRCNHDNIFSLYILCNVRNNCNTLFEYTRTFIKHLTYINRCIEHNI